MDREKVVGWIQKLMSKAMDPAVTPQEANALQEKVAQLMAKYKIDEMEATTVEEIDDHDMAREEVKFYQKGRMNWGFMLAWGIAPVFECQAVRKHKSQIMMFFGFPQDVEIVVYFFRFFQLEIIALTEKSGYRTVKDRNSYSNGMAKRLIQRINDTYKRAKEIIPSDCRELMVVKEQAVERYVKLEIGPVSNSRINTNWNGSAYAQGFRDGDRVNIVNPNLDKIRN
jgi:hypothetical protein